MDYQKQKFFNMKVQEVSGFNCKPYQGLLFLDNNSFIQQGGHKGDEDKIQEPDSSQLKDKQIYLSEMVLNDTNQCQKYTEDDVFSVGDTRFYDLYPQNKKMLPEFTHDIIFKNCISNYTQSDVFTKNCNTPIKLNQGQLPLDLIIKANKNSQNEKQGNNLSANVISDNQAGTQNCIQNPNQQEFDLYPESNNTQKIQKIDNLQQKINSTKLNIDNNFYQKKQQDSITFSKQQKSELSKLSSLSEEQNNLHSTCTPNNKIIRENKSQNLKFTVSLIYLSNIETKMGYNTTWLSNLNFSNKDHIDQYLITYYWSITQFMHSGSDLFKPQTKIELVYGSALTIILGSVLFFSIFTVFLCIFDSKKDQDKYKKSVRVLTRLLYKNNIDGQLQQRVKHYMLSVKQKQRNEDLQQEQQAIKNLPKKLQDEIIQGINSKVFQKMSFYTHIFSQSTNNELINKMKKVIFNPNETIFEEGKLDDQSVYLITDGIVEIFQAFHNTERVVASLQKNSCFGEISFFSGKTRSASARSVNFSTAYKITRQDFLEVIQSKQKDHERQKLIQELILFQNDLKCIKVKCFGCQQIGHTVDKCSILKPQFDKQFIFLRQRFEHINQRKLFFRKTNKNSRVNCLLNIKANREILKKLLIDLNIPQSLYSTEPEEDEYEDDDQFTQILQKKKNENQNNNYNNSIINENILCAEEISPKLQKTRSIKSVSSKKHDINHTDKDYQLQQVYLKEQDQSNISIHSILQSPNFIANNQDTQSEIIKEQVHQANQLPRINSDFTRITFEEDQLKRKSKNESLDRVSQKQSLLSSVKDIYKSLSNDSNIPSPFIPSISLNGLDKIWSQLSSSYDNEELDKKFQYYYEQIKDPSINVVIKDMASFNNLKKIDQLSLKQIYDMKLNQIIQSIPFIQNQNNSETSSYLDNHQMSTSINNYSLIFQQFDKICHFTKFFPHNNFNQIQKQLQKIQIIKLQNIKQINSNYQSQKIMRNMNKQLPSNNQKYLHNQDEENQILYQSQGITSVSYGIGYSINPKRGIQNQLIS
ncbi:cyclic nucleotide-binding domain protein (macronuclear) [Tetrahymena thermophila SB210]|uniref:Cyclic nucleotide-binding domain protein n=1 Tax=Tetrahymena thermophila (strain SB210) TaxID=312017 RepID=Q22G19_TETTS|nr:cyclic nucleotide-binding domain protein [Tetrahymena thermophila SB210]EAR84207.2 cyclic nucleotide-binding domain protein [Tetrahymena thermophila SB210]|eukprot:XP_001031870.2 cyclic nucleotide-binding domain protein [Tetrahymena thermophila SB210]